MFSFIRFKLIVLGLFSMNIHVAKTKYVLIPIPQPYLRMSAFKPFDANGAFMAGGPNDVPLVPLAITSTSAHQALRLGHGTSPIPLLISACGWYMYVFRI